LGCLYLLAPQDVMVVGPLTECLDTIINTDIYLQVGCVSLVLPVRKLHSFVYTLGGVFVPKGPVLRQGYLRASSSCGQSFANGWVVLRPWSLAVYASPAAVSSARPPILLPTSALFPVSQASSNSDTIKVRLRLGTL
jgi:hypothetical protein